MSSTVIDAHRVACRYGDRTILSPIDLRVVADDRLALIGDNGSGKSTLLAILAGRADPGGGRVRRFGTLAYLPQLGRHGEAGDDRTTTQTVREAALDALGIAEATRALERAESQLATVPASGADDDGRDDGTDAITAHAVALERWLTAGGATVDGDLESATARVGLASSLLDRPIATLSSGQGVRAALLPLAARRHDAVLLDEPTNHLDAGGRALLDSLLEAHGGAVVVASHDRAFLARYATRILALDARGGEATAYAGGWAAYEREAELARRGAEEAYASAMAERDALREAEREIRRRAVSTQNKIGRTQRDGDKHVKEWFRMRADGVEARGRVVGQRADRVEIPDKPWLERPLALQLTPGESRAPHVVSLEGVVVRRGTWSSPVFDVDVALGDRVLLRGPNGSGKSTLLEALAGTAELAAGRRHAGAEAVVSVLGAVESALRADEVLTTVVRRLTGLEPAEARGRLAHAGLTAEVAGRPASTLSPGERTRAELAVLGARRTTCLLLDEPSNHLDLRSLEALEAALEGWPGALVVATHDERLAERLRPTREIVL